MKKLLALAFSAMLLVFCQGSFAADLKVGVIDVQKILTSVPQVSAMRTKLQKQFEPREKEVEAAKKDLQANLAKYNKDVAVMSDKQKKDMQDKLTDQQKKLRDMETNFQQSVMTEQNKAMQEVSKTIQAVVDKVAKAQNLDLILIKGAIAFSKPEMDITQKIIDALK
jgi:outer membrane protein